MTLGYIYVLKGGTGMPNNQNRSNQDFSKFDSMTNEELEEILRSDAQKTEGEVLDLEMLLYAMEVLAVRRKNSADPRKTAEEAFKSFEENYFPAKQYNDDLAAEISNPKQCQRSNNRILPWLRRVTAVAAILAVVLFSAMTAQAMGIDIWGIVVNWTQDTFHFGTAHQDEIIDPINSDEREFSSLQEALSHLLIDTNLAPSWFPDGYNLADIEIHESPMQLMILAIYQNKEKMIKIQIKDYVATDSEQVEQSDPLIEEYESNGTVYYIFADNANLQAVWIKENYECYISGPLTIDEIRSMIDSI